jgi:hypothetical protein
MKTDLELRQDVETELAWNPKFDLCELRSFGAWERAAFRTLTRPRRDARNRSERARALRGHHGPIQYRTGD